jgi:hypothetical protein
MTPMSRLAIAWNVRPREGDGWRGTEVRESPSLRATLLVKRPGDNALCPARHLLRGASREREKQDPFRVHSFEHQVRDAVCERVGLARACSRNYKQRPGAIRTFAISGTKARRCLLGGIEAIEDRSGRCYGYVGKWTRHPA